MAEVYRQGAQVVIDDGADPKYIPVSQTRFYFRGNVVSIHDIFNNENYNIKFSEFEGDGQAYNTQEAIVGYLSSFIGSNSEEETQFLLGFKIPPYDSIHFTYIADGNGVGEVETTVYKLGAVVVATLTNAYNAQGKVSSITKT